MEQIENHMAVDSCWEPFYKPTLLCSECDGGIYEGDSYYDFNGEAVCETCMERYVEDNFRRYV